MATKISPIGSASAIEIFNTDVDSDNCHSTNSVSKIIRWLNLKQENNHGHENQTHIRRPPHA